MLTAEDIKGYNLFTGLDEAELSRIAGLCARRTYGVNEVIFDPNNISSEVYLLEGENESVQIEVPIKNGTSKITIHTLSKGETFGWAPLSPNQIRTAAARVIKPATVIQIDGPGLVRMLDENNRMGYLVMKNLSSIISSRLEQTTLVLRQTIQNVRRRLVA